MHDSTGCLNGKEEAYLARDDDVEVGPEKEARLISPIVD